MKEIQKVARRAEAEWPGVVQAEDMAQDVALHILESPSTVTALFEMDDVTRYRTLHRIAQRLASQERTEYEHFTGNFRYSVNEVKRLLENGILTESAVDLQSAWSAEEFVPTGNSYQDSTNLMVSVELDFKTALRRLEEDSPQYHDVIIRKYVSGELVNKTGGGHSRLSRALARLTELMNNGHKRRHSPTEEDLTPGKSLGDGPGTRKAVSTSTARYLSKEGWDADYVPAPAHMRDNHIEPEVWQ